MKPPNPVLLTFAVIILVMGLIMLFGGDDCGYPPFARWLVFVFGVITLGAAFLEPNT